MKLLFKLINFQPEFLLLSMGFDAEERDPLANFKLLPRDFYEITKRAITATNKFTKGKVVSILEGGYDLQALSESIKHHLLALKN